MLEFFRKGRADFFFLLIDSMKVVHDGICALKNYLEDQNKVNAGKVFTLQREAEEKRRLLLDELNKTFATPIDREDLYAMSKTMDDIMDYGKSTVEELEVFGLKPDAYLLKLAGCLAAGSGEILSAIERLERNPGVAMEHAVQAKKIENEMETIYRDAQYAPAHPKVLSVDPEFRAGKHRTVFLTPPEAMDALPKWVKVFKDLF